MKLKVIFLSIAVLTVSIFSFSAPQSIAGEKTGFQWVETEKGITDLKFGDQPVLRYMHAYDTSTDDRAKETYKVFHHVFGPKSGKLITKGPGGLYTHHRGLFMAWNKTGFEGKSLDFWHCTKGAHQRHEKFLKQSADDKSGSMTAEIHWNDAEGKPVVVETRTVTVSKGAAKNSWQIDWSTKLESKRGKITFNGDRQHAGFQFRAAQAVAESKNATYIRPTGYPQDPKPYQVNDSTDPEKHADLGWLAMTYEIDDSRYSVEYLEAPNHPNLSRYSERPYGRFGAFFVAVLSPEKPLEMQYRVIVSEGKAPTQANVQKHYETFLADIAGKK